MKHTKTFRTLQERAEFGEDWKRFLPEEREEWLDEHTIFLCLLSYCAFTHSQLLFREPFYKKTITCRKGLGSLAPSVCIGS